MRESSLTSLSQYSLPSHHHGQVGLGIELWGDNLIQVPDVNASFSLIVSISEHRRRTTATANMLCEHLSWPEVSEATVGDSFLELPDRAEKAGSHPDWSNVRSCEGWAPTVGGMHLRESSLTSLSQRSLPSSLHGQVGFWDSIREGIFIEVIRRIEKSMKSWNKIMHVLTGNRSKCMRIDSWNGGSAFLHNKINQLKQLVHFHLQSV